MHKKWLVLKASNGGLGDSIKAFLVASVYASLTNRVLVVDWKGGVYAEGNHNIFDDLFEPTNLSYDCELPNSDDIFPTAWLGRLDLSLDTVYNQDGWVSWQRTKVIETYSFDLSKLDYSYDVLVMWEFDQAEKLCVHIDQAKTSFDVYRYASKKFLQFSGAFLKKFEQHNELFSNRVVGVHIRATDEFNVNKGKLPIANYCDVINKILKKETQTTLFLATDNNTVQLMFNERYDNVYSVKKWFSKPGQPLHLNQSCPNQRLNAMNALMDIVLLSYCDVIVITPRSSFSEIAEIFSIKNNKKTKVISPLSNTVLGKIKRLFKDGVSSK